MVATKKRGVQGTMQRSHSEPDQQQRTAEPTQRLTKIGDLFGVVTYLTRSGGPLGDGRRFRKGVELACG
jgi:hypothetical protein